MPQPDGPVYKRVLLKISGEGFCHEGGFGIQADVLLKATKVDGIYTADPKKDPSAVLLTGATYEEVHRRQLRVMDLTAITLCMEQKIPLVVFNLKTPGNIARVLRGEPVGTKI